MAPESSAVAGGDVLTGALDRRRRERTGAGDRLPGAGVEGATSAVDAHREPLGQRAGRRPIAPVGRTDGD